ncbi:uncharacterized protein LODBEIA_P09460 [Lodderomyces beijingensis]|uniref:histidine kinase n=1 Tax=Lodderomyces beijingensis TaxID=1775926 RepID=A0ABP0ZKM9_9ASCO
MRRLKIGIRPQLIVLVCFASLFSLLILGIVTGLYFSENLTDLRSERLYVISQLKTTQVQQAVAFVAYQVGTLASIDSITTPLSQYRAGNNSREVFVNAQDTLEQFMSSTETFASVRLYNLELQVMASSYNNATVVSQFASNALYPLQPNASIPQALLNTASSEFYFTGPIANDSSDAFSHYFMGVTLPVYSNSSILIDRPYVAGYLSIIASASTVQNALNASTEDYGTVAVKPLYAPGSGNPVENESDGRDEGAIGFQAVFPSTASVLVPGTNYNINASSAISTAIQSNSGTSTNVKAITGENVAIGFTRIYLNNLLWVIVAVQRKEIFNEPIERLKKIIVGVVIGIGVFMCLITFPLAVWFIRPIRKLKESTEAITGTKKQREFFHKGSDVSSSGSHEKLETRGSVSSAKSGGSYSTGIRLPNSIRLSKRIFKDELTELSEAFNIMTDELDKQYTHLEDRVKLRTRELEASKIEAEAANEAKTVFIANISHELRTPLNGILGMTSIAMAEKDPNRVHDSLSLISRSGELLLHILTELLTYSKNTLNRSKLEKSEFLIMEIVYQIRSIFHKNAHDHRVNFKMLVKPNALRRLVLFGDSNRIIQIVMNLVSNSLKFTPVDGHIDVTFRLLGEYDHERSESCNFEKVYVKNNPNLPPPPSTISPSLGSVRLSTEVAKRRRTQESLDPILEKNVIDNNNNDNNNDNNNAVDLDGDNNDNDNISIVTLSTAQYENVIFEQQFHTRHKKTLSLSTRNADDSSATHYESSDSKNTSSTSDDSLTPTDEKTEIDARVEQRHYIMPKEQDFKSYPTFDKKDRFESNDSIYASGDKSYPGTTLREPRTWVLEISVSDTGPGIEPALQERVFEPFVQGDQTLSRSYGGTGLGLSICRQLAKMMHGSLTLKSTIGQGSTFTLCLPLKQTAEINIPSNEWANMCQDEFNPDSKFNRRVVFADEMNADSSDKDIGASAGASAGNGQGPSSNDSPGSDDAAGTNIYLNANSSFANNATKSTSRLKLEDPQVFSKGSTGTATRTPDKSAHLTGLSISSPSTSSLMDDICNLKILVAEDNEVNQEVIKRMLKLEGFTNVVMAANGADAVELIRDSLSSSQPKDAFDLVFMDVQMPIMDGITAVKILRQNLKYTKPIIALTAFADDSNIRECKNAGMDGFLAKPIKRANLKKIISEKYPVLLKEVVVTPHSINSQKSSYFSGVKPTED